MTDAGEVEKALGTARSEAERHLFFAAILAREVGLAEKDFIVVGGSALEVYVMGAYTSGDIDVVAYDRKRVERVLRSWGFTKPGRPWVHEDWQLFVDLMLDYYTGDRQKTQRISTPFGAITIAAVEDLLVKRLSAAKNWKSVPDREQALLLLMSYDGPIDWAYVERFAKQEQVEALLRDLREEAARKKAAEQS